MRKAIKVILVLVIIGSITMIGGFFALLALDTTNTQAEQQQVLVFTPQALLVEANRLRAEKGVAPLVIDERLNQSAQWKADDMAKFGYFNHVKPGETGKNGTQKAIDLTGKDCKNVSENLNSVNDININRDSNPFSKTNGWPTSKPHYEAIINPKYDTTGFGTIVTKNQVYYVQHFCDLR